MTVAKFKIPDFPGEAISAYGSIWVSTHRGSLLYRIDPKTNQIVKRLEVLDATCWQEADGGKVWVFGCGDGTGRSIDPRTNKVGPRVSGDAVYHGGGSVWLQDGPGTTLERRDPKTHVLIKRFPNIISDPNWGLNGYAYGAAWISQPGTVTRVDAATNTVTVIPLPGAALQPGPTQGYACGYQMAFTAGKVWFGNPAGLFEIDPTTNKATLLKIPIGNFSQLGNISVVAGAGSVWVRTSESDVSRIDPATGQVTRHYPVPAGGGGGDIVVANGSLWVINPGLDSVWRIPIA